MHDLLFVIHRLSKDLMQYPNLNTRQQKRYLARRAIVIDFPYLHKLKTIHVVYSTTHLLDLLFAFHLALLSLCRYR